MQSHNRITNADVLVALRSIADGAADLVIADPPYGIEKHFGHVDNWDTIDQWREWCKSWLLECKRILNPTGSVLLYGIHHYLCYNQIQLYELGLKYRRQIIWHYENGFCGNRTLRATYEPLLWFSNSGDYYFDPIREPYKSNDRLRYQIKKNGKIWKPNADGRLAGDVWTFPTLAGRRFRSEKVDHPTQKPLNLSTRLVTHFCPPNGLVVVPFAGSGSECVAAYLQNRRFIGIEINSYYCEIAAKRLAEAGCSQASLKEEIRERSLTTVRSQQSQLPI